MSKKKIKMPVLIALIGATALSSLSLISAGAAAEDNTTATDNSLKAETTKPTLHKMEDRGMCFKIMNLDKAAELLGMDEDELKTKLKENDGNLLTLLEDAGKLEEYKESLIADQKTRLDELVAAGKLTQEKADEFYNSFKENVENMNFNISIKDDVREDFKFGEFGAKVQRFGLGGIHMNNENILGILNITQEEFEAALEENDNSLYDVLDKYGKIDEYKESVLNSAKEKINSMVESGKITQEQADEIIAKAEESMQNFNSDSMKFFTKSFNKGDIDGKIQNFRNRTGSESDTTSGTVETQKKSTKGVNTKSV